MSHLPHSIELHDSRISAVVAGEGDLRICLRPAYIHDFGKGWRQDADIVVRSASLNGDIFELPTLISDGTANTKNGPYHNLLMLPLNDDGPVSLKLELANGKILTITGMAMFIDLFGNPIYVEVFRKNQMYYICLQQPSTNT